MTLLSLSQVERSYGDLLVFEDVSFRIDEKDRIGIIGDNGAGKTTLVKILTGLEAPDRGERAARRELRIAWADQIPSLEAGTTVLEAARSSFDELHRMEEELRKIEERLAEEPENAALLKRHESLHTAFEAGGGYRREHFVLSALTGLGFSEEDLDKPVEVLSGGEKSRVALARLMLLPAELLILDEPTNHLDLQGIEFLEEWLTKRDGAFVVVSHDRRFLDRVCRSILEVEGGRITRFRGNYSAYREQKERNLKTLLREHKKQQEYFDKEMAYIRKHMGGRWTAQAKGRLKRLSRMERIAKPKGERRRMGLRLGKAKGLEGQCVVEAEGLSFRFDNGKELFRNLAFRIHFGERIGIVGRNGVGKSTLLRCVRGSLQPTGGRVEHAMHFNDLYFTQQMEDLPTSGSVLSILQGDLPDWTEGELRSHLGGFEFSEHEVDKDVSVLSGGEKRRLCLARLLVREADVLLLDEPTNHLDIATREVLEEAIAAYGGTVIAITHDRYFLEQIGGRILELTEDRVINHEGGLEDFERALRERRRAANEADRRQRAERREERRQEKRVQTTDASASEKIRNPYGFAKLEERIFDFESELEGLLEELGSENAWKDPDRSKELQSREGEIRKELKELYERWENWQ